MDSLVSPAHTAPSWLRVISKRTGCPTVPSAGVESTCSAQPWSPRTTCCVVPVSVGGWTLPSARMPIAVDTRSTVISMALLACAERANTIPKTPPIRKSPAIKIQTFRISAGFSWSVQAFRMVMGANVAASACGCKTTSNVYSPRIGKR